MNFSFYKNVSSKAMESFETKHAEKLNFALSPKLY